MNEKQSDRFGEIAYNAYCESVGWKSAINGDKLPEFDKLSEKIRAAWIAASESVRQAVLEDHT